MTTALRGQPPGRAGLTWLGRRHTVATRGSDLLERKLRILLSEEQAYAMNAQRTEGEWQRAVGEFERWMLRSALLSGERGLRLATDGADAAMFIDWHLTMGVRYPAGATCEIPREPGGFVADNTALRQARTAAQEAVRAAVAHAVATTALAAIRAEIARTRRQLRALQRRWLPRLEAAEAHLLIQLDDLEHDEHVRLRWAAGSTRWGGNRP
jgi:V/A-type H+-transporting ATPase subunit D